MTTESPTVSPEVSNLIDQLAQLRGQKLVLEIEIEEVSSRLAKAFEANGLSSLIHERVDGTKQQVSVAYPSRRRFDLYLAQRLLGADVYQEIVTEKIDLKAYDRLRQSGVITEVLNRQIVSEQKNETGVVTIRRVTDNEETQ